MKTFTLTRSASCLAMATSLVFSSAAWAQTADADAVAAPSAAEQEEPALDSGEILVTGTRIKGVAPAGSPIISIGQEAIQATGATNATEVLRQLPQVFNLGADDSRLNTNQGANGNISSGSAINLRGLGTDATLVLLNGRRLPIANNVGATSGSGGFDPTVIPTAAIGSAEVMPDGGSAIYGSEAVGGVVNMFLRNPFDGAEFSARYGFADGFDQKTVTGALGKTWDTGGIMFAFDVSLRDNLEASKRAQFTDNFALYGGVDRRINNSNPGTIQVGNVFYAIPTGQNGVGLTAARLIAGTTNKTGVNEGADILPEQRRRAAAINFNQDIADGVRFNFQGFYSNRRAIRAQGVAAFAVNLTVPRTNAFFVHPTNPAAANVSVLYDFSADYGPVVRDGRVTAGFGVASIDADLWGDWSGSVYASYGRDRERTLTNAINSAQLAAALADPNPATAFNPFGDGSFTPRATLDKIAARTDFVRQFTHKNAGASLSGSLFHLPAGPVKIAVGADYQHVELYSANRPNTGTANNTLFQETVIVPTRSIKSGYAELYVPVFGAGNSMPGLRELSLSLAARHDSYSDVGSTTNPKFGIVWKPTDDLKIRGSYGTSFKAPAPIPAVNVLSISLQNFVDPTSPTGTTRTLWVRSGQEGLRPETATTWSAGFDLKPSWLPGSELSVTYFNVDYRDRIAAPGNDTSPLTKAALLTDYIIRNPSAALVTSYLSRPEYTGVQENPANILAIVDGRPKNIGQLQTDGLEFNARYGWGTNTNWHIAGSAVYTFNYKQKFTRTDPLVDFSGRINYPVKFQGRAEAGWASGGFSATGVANFVSSYTNDSVAPVQKIPAYATFDLALRYDASALVKGLTLMVDASNVFDSAPPVVFNGTLAFDPEKASLVGRLIQVGARIKF
ncbi:TonB-dependent receptor plug domain-containing protein [Sphingomonas soli]|uniref:TonB-dependent receptor plug domain-containing protein n=1 Tax=Sphingomonas soli TaxID=266127 RepID=UPI00083017A8|nr:TonB-dependent receptor [Sphingomonas soli]